jgi:hypothetical protein
VSLAPTLPLPSSPLFSALAPIDTSLHYPFSVWEELQCELQFQQQQRNRVETHLPQASTELQPQHVRIFVTFPLQFNDAKRMKDADRLRSELQLDARCA